MSSPHDTGPDRTGPGHTRPKGPGAVPTGDARTAPGRAVEDPVLEVTGVTKRYADVVAVDDVSLAVRRGEVLSVVGPSGCGKTTLLQVVAGLSGIDAGEVRIEGRSVAGRGVWVPPERRRVGVVFQDHALFPHLSVADNIAFGLRRGGGRTARLAEVLDLVRLAHLADRYPHELSGGEQQRVALARALAPRPAVVLFDEPFSSLDQNLRVGLRQETVEVLRNAGTTAVFVTHDQEEALSVGDRVAVLHDGRIEQVATPQVIFSAPGTRFVATFIGEADLLAGRQKGTTAWTTVGPLPVAGAPAEQLVDVMVRPHEVRLVADADGDAIVRRAEFRGAYVHLEVELDDGAQLRCWTPHTQHLPIGTRVRVTVDAGHPLASFPVGQMSTIT